MKIPFDPSHFEMPVSLFTSIIGAVVSGVGIVAATAVGWLTQFATIDPAELAIQPLHVVLIAFIIAEAAFIVLILRAVWGKGIETVNRFSSALEKLVELNSQRSQKMDELSFEALKEASTGK